MDRVTNKVLQCAVPLKDRTLTPERNVKQVEYITRKKARLETCRFTFDDVRRINGKPGMDCCECIDWLDEFASWIESAYDGRSSAYEEMASRYNADRPRKFIDRDGKTVSFYRVIDNYLKFMCYAENYGKAYTVSRFKNYVKENFKEVMCNG